MAEAEKKFGRRTFLDGVTKAGVAAGTLSLGATFNGLNTEEKILARVERYCHPSARQPENNHLLQKEPWVDYHPPRERWKKIHQAGSVSNDDEACIAVVNTGKEVLDRFEISGAATIGSYLTAVIARHFSRQRAAGTPDNGQSRG